MIKNTTIEPTDFNSELAKRYQELALSEADQFDWGGAEYFAKKARKALQETYVLPEDPHAQRWSGLSQEDISTFKAARDYLLQAYLPQAKDSHYELLAEAQVYYDCWLEQQHEGWQKQDIFSCRDLFFEAIESLRAQLPILLAPDIVTVAPEIANQLDVIEPLPPCYTIHFDFNKSQLSPQATNHLDHFTNRLNQSQWSHTLWVEGFADRAGHSTYNIELSQKRAESVKGYLQDSIVADKIDIHVNAHGEKHAKLPTADGKREALNRRVEIWLTQPHGKYCDIID